MYQIDNDLRVDLNTFLAQKFANLCIFVTSFNSTVEKSVKIFSATKTLYKTSSYYEPVTILSMNLILTLRRARREWSVWTVAIIFEKIFLQIIITKLKNVTKNKLSELNIKNFKHALICKISYFK